jgi:hypothetical protein
MKGVRTKAAADIAAFYDAMVSMHGRIGGSAGRRFLAGEWQRRVGLLMAARRMFRARRHQVARVHSFVRRKAMGHYRGFPRDMPGAPSSWLRQVSRGHQLHVVGSAPAWLDTDGVSR